MDAVFAQVENLLNHNITINDSFYALLFHNTSFGILFNKNLIAHLARNIIIMFARICHISNFRIISVYHQE